MRIVRALLAVAAGLTAAACSSGPPDEEAAGDPSRPPIVLISIDTLRSDRLPAYGYEGVETPAIDRLAADGLLFERAFTHANLTLPAHASLFTGLLPPEHGVRDNAGYRLEETVPTLAAELQRIGYATGGFVSSYVLRADTGIGRGFDVYDDAVALDSRRPFGQLQRRGEETLAPALEWLGGVADSAFFLFLHVYEPHAPYEPPAPFAQRYEDAYDGEVAAAAAVVGDLIRRLEELGLYDQALIVLLSDHGEGLMDHGEMDHLVFIYREVIQVPLIVKLPRGERAGERVAANAQLADLAPTVYSLVGLDQPSALPGVDLLGLPEAAPDDAPRRIVSESVYPRVHFGWSDLASVIEGDLHFIESPDPELYDLEQDPAERTNLLQQDRAAARRLRAALAEVDRVLVSPLEEDPETRQRLRSLGYLSGGARSSGESLADPKSRIDVIAELARATALIGEGSLAEAEAALGAVLRREPQMADIWQQLGDVLERQGRPRGALEAYRRAFEVSEGQAASAGLKIAELLLRDGKVAAAREHALALADHSPMANDLLAQAALAENDLASAETYLQRALEERGFEIGPLITRMSWLNRQGRFEEAVAQSEAVVREFGDREDREVLAELYLHRGTALAALNRSDEAANDFQAAIGLRRELLGAWSSLAFLHALEGRAAETGRTLQEMVTVNPNARAYAEAVRALRAMNDQAAARGALAEALRRWPENEELRLLAGSF